MIRYYIETKTNLYYWLDRELTQRYPIITDQNRRVYLDVLSFGKPSIKVKLYLDDGCTIIGFLPNKLENPIKLSNMDELFDGRFNS